MAKPDMAWCFCVIFTFHLIIWTRTVWQGDVKAELCWKTQLAQVDSVLWLFLVDMTSIHDDVEHKITIMLNTKKTIGWQGIGSETA